MGENSIIETDIAVLGNNAAASGFLYGVKREIKENPSYYNNLRIDVFDRSPEDSMPDIHGTNVRITFLEDLSKMTGKSYEDFEDAIVTIYEEVDFYSPNERINKNLPEGDVALMDMNKLYSILQADLIDNVNFWYNSEICDARYILEGKKRKGLEMDVQDPRDWKIRKAATVHSPMVIDCSGTANVLKDKFLGRRNSSKYVCNLAGVKVIARKKMPRPYSAVLVLDEKYTKNSGAWFNVYGKISQELYEDLQNKAKEPGNEELKEILKGKSRKDLEGMVFDVGLSSISAYAQEFHYENYLKRQLRTILRELPFAKDYFDGSVLIPNTEFIKASPNIQLSPRMTGDSFLFTGDSAGHATTPIGEGIRPALEMGIAGAKVVLDAYLKGDFSEKNLQGYEDEWSERYGEHAFLSGVFRGLLMNFGDKEWDIMFKKMQKTMSDSEFYRVLQSKLTFNLAKKMFDVKLGFCLLRNGAGSMINM